MKILEILNSLIKSLSGIALGLMTLLVILEVVYRYLLNSPLSFTQDSAIFAMVYVVMLGSTIAVRNRAHIAVDFVGNMLPARYAYALRLITYGIMLFFFFILLKNGWTLTMRSMMQISPSLGIPIGYVIFSIPLSAGISMLYILEHMIKDRPTKK